MKFFGTMKNNSGILEIGGIKVTEFRKIWNTIIYNKLES